MLNYAKANGFAVIVGVWPFGMYLLPSPAVALSPSSPLSLFPSSPLPFLYLCWLSQPLFILSGYSDAVFQTTREFSLAEPLLHANASFTVSSSRTYAPPSLPCTPLTPLSILVPFSSSFIPLSFLFIVLVWFTIRAAVDHQTEVLKILTATPSVNGLGRYEKSWEAREGGKERRRGWEGTRGEDEVEGEGRRERGRREV